jgi:hypothetical protein
MKINRIITAALLLSVTAAYADRYTVDIYNLTPYEGSRKVFTQTALAKDSKFRRLPPRREVTNPTGTATPQRRDPSTGRPIAKQYEPGVRTFTTKMDGALLYEVVVKLKTIPASQEITQEVSYSIPAGLAGKHWKFIVFQDPQTGTIQICGFSKATSDQETAAHIPVLNLPLGFVMLGYLMAGEGDVKRKASDLFGITQEWSQRACEGFVSTHAKSQALIKSKL